jgi:glutaconyl-CoA/methylmalonyl-CoA decarboxylase subunit gamma
MCFIPILAVTKADVTMLDALPHLAGMLMVVVVLAVLWGVCAFTAKMLQIFAPEPKAAAVPVSKATAKPTMVPKPIAPEGIPSEIVAVITAAVATFNSQPYHIISIRPMNNGRKKLVAISPESRNPSINQTTTMDRLRITVEGKIYDVTVEKTSNDASSNLSAPAAVVRSAAPAKAIAAAPTPKPAAAGGGKGDAPSPLAGIVQAIDAAVGATVSEGDLVITLEAMKMYTPINAPVGGTITAIHVQVGDAVEEGQILYTIG